MQFIIFDLEATCWDGNAVGRQQEIIEIGAVRMDQYGEYHGTFQRFVQPILHPQLSVYCKRLTGIEQSSVYDAKTFDRVITQFTDWIEDFDEEPLLCSWGNKDHTFLMQDSALHRIPEDWMPAYIDLKEQYHHIKSLNKKIGLKRTLDREGFGFEGSHHRALDDAKNLCLLFHKYLDLWMY